MRRSVRIETKAETNAHKHGVTFTEASRVFDDPCAHVIGDPDHFWDEGRFIILGKSIQAWELVVPHRLRGAKGGVIGIISARKATRNEAEQYWRYVHA